ncbi:hypothetical protein AOXY_G19898 [Acipenser oxyrinchus oxyrinchus]|uniref:Uncharacterized protein n=1 Tax=Acipenser oxyrinchus oxyrinchus TaxID=40147 RepID=A0AAD8FXL9_ACIOX|nr:hypothetical protein AOXY_G19898 [Acipenser oxyrinchus oxyrinchus]
MILDSQPINWPFIHFCVRCQNSKIHGAQYLQVCCSKYVQHSTALLGQVSMCTGQEEAWVHREQSNGNQNDLFSFKVP